MANNASISLTDTYGNAYHFANLGNGLVNEALPLSDSFTVTAAAPNLYATVTPASFNTTVNQPTPVSIAFATAPAIKNVLVGYLDLSVNDDTTIMDAVNHGYNIVVVGWGQVNGDTPSLYPATAQNVPTLAADIAAAHQAGAKVLLTFGGEANTFSPTNNATAADAQQN